MSAHKFNTVVKGYNKASQPKPEAQETPADEMAESPEQQAQEQAQGTEEHCPSCGHKLDFTGPGQGMTIEIINTKKRK